MSLFDRLSSVLSGLVEGQLSAVEANNPQAVYAAAIEAAERRLAELKARLVAQLADQRRREPDVALDDQLAETRAALEQLQVELAALRVESTRALADRELAAAKVATQALASGLSDDADIQAVGNVRSDILRTHERAHEGWLDSEGRPVHARVARLEKLSALEQAQAELARLKAARDGTPSPDADADGDV